MTSSIFCMSQHYIHLYITSSYNYTPSPQAITQPPNIPTVKMSTPKYTNKLHAKNVLVLGGTSGIGFCVAEAALEYGATITVSGSREAKLSLALSRLRTTLPPSSPSSLVSGKTCDLADPTTLESNLDALLRFATADGTRPLDHIVYTAGDAIAVVPVSQATPADVAATLAVRFVAPVILAKLVPRYVRQSSESSLTLTSGVGSWKPPRDWAIIAGVGSGVEGLTRGFAVDLMPVRVNAVAPGAVHTEIFDFIPKEQLEAFLESHRKGSLTGTIGKPQDCAEAYLYCMRDYFVTGEVVATNGGKLLA
ncbi:short-chain dehydrogenase [Lasiosphaeria hispida]|uniref:Short-chain dehydrogenase n=1 Tax=Lasiosphaeria hispida TaxID=260671 RepID=A0AAJ0MIU8_9PEZI|nr:short-chain dehydrogenase [Lasiosphaeria hispida]